MDAENNERINAAKKAAFAVPDGDTFIFVLPDRKQIEIDFRLLAEWFCQEFDITIDWSAG